jgi:hypothetical protein
MPTVPIAKQKVHQVRMLLAAGKSHREIHDITEVGMGSISRIRQDTHIPIAPVIQHDKKKADFNWREWADHAIETQKLYKRASHTQTHANVEIPAKQPILVMPFSDQHIGGRGVDYVEFIRLTNFIIDTPNLYVILHGDEAEFAIKLRSVAEVCAQLFEPTKQQQFIEQWFDEIAHKVICATWCNHVQEREEKQSGVSSKKLAFAPKTVYFDGIGHLDLKVGTQTYKIAVSHKFRGYSFQNPCHAGMRYMRFEGSDREIAIMGDIHQPSYISYADGATNRLSLVSGTLNINSAYAQRYFSLFTQANYPVIEFHHEQHEFTTFTSLDRWLRLQK